MNEICEILFGGRSVMWFITDIINILVWPCVILKLIEYTSYILDNKL